MADSTSSAWHSNYSFGGTTRHQVNMNQADLIAKREAGYYDSIGRNSYNYDTTVINTTTIGSVVESTTNINGDTTTNLSGDNNTVLGGTTSVDVSGTTSGDLNGSVNFTTSNANTWNGAAQ